MFADVVVDVSLEIMLVFIVGCEELHFSDRDRLPADGYGIRCTGGGRNILDRHLKQNYLTNCDPRLNAEQSLELAFQIAEMIRS